MSTFLDLCRSLSVGDLAAFRHALKLDIAQAEREHNPRAAAFCRERLVVIDQVFRELETAATTRGESDRRPASGSGSNPDPNPDPDDADHT
jgi:hypothetical protein